MKTATFPWLLVAGLVGLANSACNADKDSRIPAFVALPPGVQQIGYIRDSLLMECSGVVASRQYPAVFWTHNDGDKPRSYILFAITRDGTPLRQFQFTGAALHDWEDIAIDNERHLYVGDIGNNDARRFEIAVHEIDEPDPKGAKSFVTVKRSWRLRFPKAPFDCESLFVWAGYGYVVSKVFNDAKAEIYRFPLTNQTAPFTLELVTRTKIDSPVTGADISADGKLLGLVAKSGAFVYDINGDVSKAGKKKPFHTKFKHEHIEGCCFVPDGLLATSEKREIFLYTNAAFHPPK